MSKGNDLNDFFDRLGVPPEKREAIQAKLNEKLSYEPKIGIFGKTGAGKSSLCNALFGKKVCDTSDIEACTAEPNKVLLKMGGTGIKLLDLPGISESQDKDKKYTELYTKLLPELDLVLWVLKGDERAFKDDELFYKNIVKPHITEGKPFFFVLNQVDKIEPFREWDLSKHSPSVNQFSNIHGKIKAVSNTFGCPENLVIPVSANEQYNLGVLVDTFLFALPKDKLYTVGRQIKKENVSIATQERIKKSWWDTVVDVAAVVFPVIASVIGAIFSKKSPKI
jgi:small GTP-binding protein